MLSGNETGSYLQENTCVGVQQSCFPVYIAKFLKTPVLIEPPAVAASVINMHKSRITFRYLSDPLDYLCMYYLSHKKQIFVS